MELNTADVLIIITIFLSTVIGVYRGFVRELLTLLTWIIASSVAYIYGTTVGQFFVFVENVILRELLGVIVVFTAVLLIGFIVKLIVCKITKLPVISAVDRLFGAVFGAVRGCVIIVLLLLIPVKDIEAKDWYKNSVLLPRFAKVADLTIKSTPHTWKEDIKRQALAILQATQKPAPVVSATPTTVVAPVVAPDGAAITIKIEEPATELPPADKSPATQK